MPFHAEVAGAAHADDVLQHLELTTTIRCTRCDWFLHGLLHGLRLHEPDRLVILAAIEKLHASSKEPAEQPDDSNDEKLKDQPKHKDQPADSANKLSTRASYASEVRADGDQPCHGSVDCDNRACLVVRAARAQTVLYDCAADELDEHLGPGPRLTIEKSLAKSFFCKINFISIKELETSGGTLRLR